MSRQKAIAFLVLLLALWWRNKKHKSTAKRIKYAPLVQRDIWRSNELIRLIDASDRICMRQLRMSRHVFYRLCARLRHRGLLVDTLHVSVEEQLAMFLKIVGQYHTQSSVTTDPYVDLWKRIEDIPVPPRDKVDIATYLSKPEQVHLRNYLSVASDQSFGTWVTDYLGAKYHATSAYDG